MHIEITEVIHWAGVWVLGWKIVSFVWLPPEIFEEWLGPQHRFVRFYRFFGKLIKYWGALDWRGQIAQLYPQVQRKLGGTDVAK